MLGCREPEVLWCREPYDKMALAGLSSAGRGRELRAGTKAACRGVGAGRRASGLLLWGFGLRGRAGAAGR